MLVLFSLHSLMSNNRSCLSVPTCLGCTVAVVVASAAVVAVASLVVVDIAVVLPTGAEAVVSRPTKCFV